MSESGQVGTASAYRERLSTPWWWYAVGIFVALLLAGEFHISGLHLTDWIPFTVLPVLAVLIVWSLGRSTVTVTGHQLQVRGASLDLRTASGAVGLDAATLRRVVGREGDPRAFVSIRPWIGPGVQVWLDDDDAAEVTSRVPCPYWVVSTRHPDQLLRVIREVIDTEGDNR